MTQKQIPTIFKILPALMIILFSACSGNKSAHPGLDDFFDSGWAMNSLWDDGLAEVAHYDAEVNIYGKARNHEQVYILVKEDFNKKFNVKTNDYERNDLFAVMKVNQFARIETDNYPYQFLSSYFYKRENPLNLHKATFSSQEWCGNTFKGFNKTNSGYRCDFNSYWDGQGEGSYNISEQALFEDQLSYSLRSLKFKNDLAFSYNVIESQINNKANKPKVYRAGFEVTDEIDENGNQLWKVTVRLENSKSNEYWFEKEYPNILVNQNTWDGRKLRLVSFERNDYWIK